MIKTDINISKPSHRHSLTSLTLLLCALNCWVLPANAEGSRELVKNGGNRPHTEWRTNTTAGIVRRTVLKVYANGGEVINLGSSAVGVGEGDILLFNDTDNIDISTPKLKCSTEQPGKGFLDTRAKEIAGPLPATGGYTPCTYTAPSSGLYKVIFYGPDGKTGTSDAAASSSIDYIANPLINGDQRSTVSMWDITVRSSTTSTTDLNGRVFTDYIALDMGTNGRYLKSNVYILTDDGYQYDTDLSVGGGIDPYGFLFFANKRGLLAPNGQTLYRTGAKPTDPSMTPPLDGGVTINPPKYPLFFNLPSNAAISGIGYPLTALPPSPPTKFLFTGGAGGSGNQTPQSVGGTFSFDAPDAGGYQIIIDTNYDGKYNVADGDRILEGSVNKGFSTVTWDGKNGDGTIVGPRPGNEPYDARVILKGGEYHFPLIDAESAAGGFKIQMLNPPGSFSNGASTTTVYFDERNYKVSETDVTLGCSPSAGLPICDGRGGVDSALGAHKYGNNTGNSNDYGDRKAIDTWIYFPSAADYAKLVITNTNKANVQGKKSVKFLTDTDGSGTVTVGDKVEYTITYSNATPDATSDAINFIINDKLPSQLTFVSAAIEFQTPDNTIALNSSYNGSGAFTTLTNIGTLRKGDTLVIKIVATINNANSGASIPNQASATFNTPDNAGSTGTIVTDADAAGATTNPPTVNNYFFQTSDDSVHSGNDPTSTNDDDPTLITVVPPKANLRLVKRVTNIGGVAITGFHDVTTGDNTADDNAAGWITSPPYLKGAFDSRGNQIPVANRPKPGDEVEYSIYFLADGTVNSQNVKICDYIPNSSTYVPNSLQLQIGTSAPVTISDTVNGTDTDGGFYSTAPFPTTCMSSNNGNGAVLVNVGTVNFSTGVGTPANSYGSVRFRVKIK